jgi:hypothetical protein
MLARRPLHACVHARDLCSGLTRDVRLAFFFLCSFFSAVADSARVSDSDMKTMAAEIRKTTLVDKVAAFHKIPLKARVSPHLSVSCTSIPTDTLAAVCVLISRSGLG